MAKPRILIVEDDPAYQQRYQEWIPAQYQMDSAVNVEQAIEKLKKNHYALVILDLSLNPESPFDRSSLEVQKYLQNVHQEEGTFHVIVSGHSDQSDARLAFRDFKAQDVIPKSEVGDDPIAFVKAIEENIKKHLDILGNLNFSDTDYKKLLGDENEMNWEYTMLQALNPRHRAVGFKHFFKNFSDKFSPIANHKTRKAWQVLPDTKCMLGIMWSRAIGHPVTVHLSHKDEACHADKAKQDLEEWLGWTPGLLLDQSEVNDVNCFVFSETDHINPTEFMLHVL